MNDHVTTITFDIDDCSKPDFLSYQERPSPPDDFEFLGMHVAVRSYVPDDEIWLSSGPGFAAIKVSPEKSRQF